MSKRRFPTRVAFAAWLETKHPRTKVGDPGCTENCPLAKFLTQTTGKSHFVGGVEAYETDKEGFRVKGSSAKLPQWAANFIDTVDSLDADSVSATTALKIARHSNITRSRYDGQAFADKLNGYRG